MYPPGIGGIDFGVMLYFLCYVFVYIGSLFPPSLPECFPVVLLSSVENIRQAECSPAKDWAKASDEDILKYFLATLIFSIENSVYIR